MQIKRQNEIEERTMVNIVSKCYVISQKIRFYDDGSFNTSYEVVFPYKEEDLNFIRQNPEFNIYNTCINSVIVDKLFTSYNEALEEKERANKRLIDKRIGLLPYDSNFSKKIEILKEEHQETIKQFDEFEQRIEDHTASIVIKDNKILQKTNK